MVTLATSLKEGNINFHQAQPKLQVGRFYVDFKGFMKLKLVSVENCQMSRFDKNEFDNNMSNLSDCSKGDPDTWSNNVDKLTPQPTYKMFQIFLVHKCFSDLHD